MVFLYVKLHHSQSFPRAPWHGSKAAVPRMPWPHKAQGYTGGYMWVSFYWGYTTLEITHLYIYISDRYIGCLDSTFPIGIKPDNCDPSWKVVHIRHFKMVWVKHVKLREVRHRGARRSYHSCRARCECGLCVSPHRAVSQGHEHWALTSLCLRQPASVSASVTVPPMPGQPRHPRTWSPRRHPRVAGSLSCASRAGTWMHPPESVPPACGMAARLQQSGTPVQRQCRLLWGSRPSPLPSLIRHQI